MIAKSLPTFRIYLLICCSPTVQSRRRLRKQTKSVFTYIKQRMNGKNHIPSTATRLIHKKLDLQAENPIQRVHTGSGIENYLENKQRFIVRRCTTNWALVNLKKFAACPISTLTTIFYICKTWSADIALHYGEHVFQQLVHSPTTTVSFWQSKS